MYVEKWEGARGKLNRGILRGFSEGNFFKVNGIPMIGGVEGRHYNNIKSSYRNTFVGFFFLKKVYLI